MRFVFKCLAVKHVSGRVSLTPLLHPELAVHAIDVARAVEELTLALDDRLSRLHPRHMADYARAAAGELISLDVPAVRVWHAADDEQRPMRFSAIVAPAHKLFTEVHLPRLAARFWLTGKQIAEPAEELVSEALEDEDDVLGLRSEGQESLLELVVEARPLALSELKRRELVLAERPPPRPGEGDDDEDGEDDAARAEDDDWADERRRRRRAASKPKRPATPTLNKIGVAWHELAHAGALEPAFESDALVDELIARVEVARPDPVVLVGPAGAGKTTMLGELARRLVAAAGPKAEKEALRPVFLVDGPRFIAGDGMFGGWQRQVLDGWKEAVAARAVLYLGRVIDLLSAGKSAHSDDNVAQLVSSLLAAREVAVIGEATPEEWVEIERQNASFARAFALLRVEEPPPAHTQVILARIAGGLAEQRKLAIEPGAIAQVLALTARFVPEGALVGNAAALLRRLVDVRAHAQAVRVTAGDALALFSSESGVPEGLLRDDLPLDEGDVRGFLAERVHGQDAAVARAARAVSVIKANLADRRRPSAVLLFTGPTGVGKTELAKALAELVFGSRERMIRLDMGELAGPDALARLLGEPGAAGGLAAQIRRQPFSLVLLDEIEKAHPAVFDALLGVLGEGRLTDASGKLADFRASIIVMTSNLGAESLRARPGFGGDAAAIADAERHYRGEAQRFFRPELWNRIDDLVVFAPLGAPQIRRIVDRELVRVCSREGLRRRDVRLEIGEAVRDRLAASGFDPRYGARPLKRAIERELVAPVAAWLAAHDKVGAQQLTAEVADDQLGLAAESLGGSFDGVSRAAIEKLLTRAAELRAEVRRFARVPAMRRLRRELAFFDRLSRQPSFWHDREVADESARAAAEGRELAGELAALEKQVEAAEDLAYEAYYARQVAAAASLERELFDLRAALPLLILRLFASLFPPRNTVALEILPARGGWEHACWLADGYESYLQVRGATCRWHVAVEREVKARAADKDKPAKRNHKPETEWRWIARGPERQDAEKPAAAVLTASGSKAIMALAGEHGVHRFIASGQTALVRVRFQFKPAPMLAPPDMEPTMPTDEIRRVWLQKATLRDLRLARELRLPDGELDFAELTELYVRHRLLGPESEA